MDNFSQGGNGLSLSGTSNPQGSVGNNGALSQNVNNVQSVDNESILNSNANNINLNVANLHSHQKTSSSLKPVVVVKQSLIPKLDLYIGFSVILVCSVIIGVVIFNSKKHYNFLIKNL